MKNMFNIEFKGNYIAEKDLIQGQKLPQNAVQFREGETVQDAFMTGFFLMLPIMSVIIATSVQRCLQVQRHLTFSGRTIIAVVIVIVSIWLLTYIHEIIHGLLYPRGSKKTIWRYSKNGMFFVYCDAHVSKKRFIIINIVPSIILGIIPFIAWTMFMHYLSVEYIIGTMFIVWYMTFMSMGDYTNVYNSIRQVPKDAKIFNYGMHSYWIKE